MFPDSGRLQRKPDVNSRYMAYRDRTDRTSTEPNLYCTDLIGLLPSDVGVARYGSGWPTVIWGTLDCH